MLEVLDGNTLKDIGLDSQDGRLRAWKLDETALGSFPVTGFGVACLGLPCFATKLLVFVGKTRKLLD